VAGPVGGGLWFFMFQPPLPSFFLFFVVSLGTVIVHFQCDMNLSLCFAVVFFVFLIAFSNFFSLPSCPHPSDFSVLSVLVSSFSPPREVFSPTSQIFERALKLSRVCYPR